MNQSAENLLNCKITDICVHFIQSKIIEFCPQSQVDMSFSALGLDSLAHVEFTAFLEKEFDLDLDPNVGFNYPTLRSMVKYLNELLNDKAIRPI